MKIFATVIGVVLLIVGGLALKAYQYNSCRADKLSHGTCLAIISR